MSLRLTKAELARLLGHTDAEMPPGGSERPQERRGARADTSGHPRRRGANPESEIQAAIADALRLRGCYVERRNSGAVRTQAGGLVRLAPVGTPDLALVLPGGRAGFVEVKRPGERPTPAQAEKHAELRGYGAVVVVAHSVDEALELLEVYL